jgi:hypothetical protein
MRWPRRSHDLFRRASEAQMRKAKFELPPYPRGPFDFVITALGCGSELDQ